MLSCLFHRTPQLDIATSNFSELNLDLDMNLDMRTGTYLLTSQVSAKTAMLSMVVKD